MSNHTSPYRATSQDAIEAVAEMERREQEDREAHAAIQAVEQLKLEQAQEKKAAEAASIALAERLNAKEKARAKQQRKTTNTKKGAPKPKQTAEVAPLYRPSSGGGIAFEIIARCLTVDSLRGSSVLVVSHAMHDAGHGQDQGGSLKLAIDACCEVIGVAQRADIESRIDHQPTLDLHRDQQPGGAPGSSAADMFFSAALIDSLSGCGVFSVLLVVQLPDNYSRAGVKTLYGMLRLWIKASVQAAARGGNFDGVVVLPLIGAHPARGVQPQHVFHEVLSLLQWAGRDDELQRLIKRVDICGRKNSIQGLQQTFGVGVPETALQPPLLPPPNHGSSSVTNDAHEVTRFLNTAASVDRAHPLFTHPDRGMCEYLHELVVAVQQSAPGLVGGAARKVGERIIRFCLNDFRPQNVNINRDNIMKSKLPNKLKEALRWLQQLGNQGAHASAPLEHVDMIQLCSAVNTLLQGLRHINQPGHGQEEGGSAHGATGTADGYAGGGAKKKKKKKKK